MHTPEIQATSTLAGRRVQLPGHFAEPVQVEAVRALGTGFELRVRRASGQLEEVVLSAEEFRALLGADSEADTGLPLADSHRLRPLIESARVRLAYAYDPHFAVSLSGIRALPHQLGFDIPPPGTSH